jgi:sulfatase maturation enzyme AslB (radical SAM superfamily)
MLAGKRSKECSACYQREDAGLPSSRQEQLERWTVDTNKQFNPVYLDIRLNNICNLKCRMCSSYFSSAIAQEEIEIYGRTAIVDGTLRNQQRKEALNEIIEFLPYAEKIYFAGGEPLLAPEHYEILERLVDCGNTNLELFYNTNFTRLQFRDIDVLELWQKFSNITVGASIDAIGNVAEYVRHGTVWSDIEKNIARLHLQCPYVNFTVTSTVGLLNARSLMQLQKSWHQTKKLDISKFSLSVMTSPDHMTVSVLPVEYKTQLDLNISDHIKWCRGHGAETLAMQWNNVLNYMWKHDSSHYLTEFKRLTTTMDKHRKESFNIVFPEYQNLI